MNKDDFNAAKYSFQTIGIDDVLEFRAWRLAYADELITALEAAQAELADVARQKNAAIGMGWKNKTQRDELRAQLAKLIDEREELVQLLADHNISECVHNPLKECRAQLAASQAVVERLRKDADWIATVTKPYG